MLDKSLEHGRGHAFDQLVQVVHIGFCMALSWPSSAEENGVCSSGASGGCLHGGASNLVLR